VVRRLVLPNKLARSGHGGGEGVVAHRGGKDKLACAAWHDGVRCWRPARAGFDSVVKVAKQNGSSATILDWIEDARCLMVEDV
jgi:hypothetical protein